MRSFWGKGKDNYLFNLLNNPEAGVTISNLQMSLAAGFLPVTSRMQEGRVGLRCSELTRRN